MSAFAPRKTMGQVGLFSILVLGLTWGSPLLGGGPTNFGPGFLLWGATPMLAAVILCSFTGDWAVLGVQPALKKYGLWYAIGFFAFPVLMLFALGSGVLLSITSFAGFSFGKFLPTFLIALPIFFIFAIFEEVGWRGYLSPKLDALGLNHFGAAILVGVIWAIWHMPYISELTWAYSSGDLATFVPRFYLACIAFALLHGAIRRVTGTFWSAALMHGVGNAFGHPLAVEYVTYAQGWESMANIGNGLILIGFVFLLGVVLHRVTNARANVSK